MAAETKGTAHFFGIGSTTMTNATIISINSSKGFDLSETTEDENGVTIETRKDNRRRELDVTLRVKTGYVFPDVGDVIAISGLADNKFNTNYEVDSVGQQYQNSSHLEQSFQLVNHEGIAY